MDLSSVFNKIDVDGSGSISKEELLSHVSSKGVSGAGAGGMSREAFDVLFDVIDIDKSGSIDFAEYSRFVDMVRNKRAETTNRRRSSIMKVPTQIASLSTPYDNIKESNTPPLPAAQPLVRSNSASRASILLSTRRQRSFHRKPNTNHDDSELNVNLRSDPLSTLRFFDVEVREYGVTASDNPGVKAGVALELSWDYNVSERMHLDAFERKRSTERSKNFRKEKKLTRLEREKILREFGATPAEIQEAAKRAALIRNGRKKSVELSKHDKFYEGWENKLHSLKNTFRPHRHSQPVTNWEFLDLERLHPTLMVMMGLDDDDNCGGD